MNRLSTKGILSELSEINVWRFLIMFGISFVFQALISFVANQFDFWIILGQAAFHPILATILGYILYNITAAGKKNKFSKSEGSSIGTVNVIYVIQLFGFILQYYTPY